MPGLDANAVTKIRTLAQSHDSADEIAALAGLEVGDVESVLGGGAVAFESESPVLLAATPGAVTVLREIFDHEVGGLADGRELEYVPVVGDILLDAWIDVDEVAWDGTTPKADFAQGPFWDAHNSGLFEVFGGAPADLSVVGVGEEGLWSQGASGNVPLSVGNVHLGSPVTEVRTLPFRFTTDDPLVLAVSQDGHLHGAAPGATRGQASIYLVVVTPIDPRMTK